MKNKKYLAYSLMVVMGLSILSGCSSVSGNTAGAKDQVVIYSNADDEAITAMKHALDSNGYEGKYIVQGFGTSELGGKLLAEGKNLEADLVTMSTFYLQSAQDANQMFLPLDFDVNTLEEFPDYCAPITSQEGAILLNTQLLKQEGLPRPESIKDLADPVYNGHLAVTDIQSSSTAWLLIQALVDSYGEDGAEQILSEIYQNAGDHIETSGSGPLKLCRAGEIAVGFGLRHQAVADKANGLPIDFADPTEGNFSLTESVSVLDKGDKTNSLAMDMAQCIIENGRKELQQTYPNPLYDGESSDTANQSAYPRTFKEPLTFELFQKHQQISENAKS